MKLLAIAWRPIARRVHAEDALRAWHTRRGWLLCLKAETAHQSHEGEGELSPLPGYSPDGLEEAKAALIQAWPRLKGQDLRPERLLEVLETIEGAFPSARFALETALIALWADAEACDLAAWLTRHRDEAWARDRTGEQAVRFCKDGLKDAASKPPAALLSGPPEGWMAGAEAALAAGRRTLKCKMGRDFEAEVQVLWALRRRFGPEIRLRLDANQSWAPGSIQARLSRLAPLGIEFIEEPGPLDAWPADPGVPLARDESLRDPSARAAEVAVLKPGLLGGGFLALAEAKRVAAKQHVWSHLYEGPVGMRAVRAWAAAYPSALDPGDIAESASMGSKAAFDAGVS